MPEITFDTSRLRIARAMRSAYNPGPPTNRATHQLYNNSTGNAVLVLRNTCGIAAVGTGFIYGQAVQGTLGSSLGNVQPLVTAGQIGPGLHYYLDDASALTPDTVFTSGQSSGGTFNALPFVAIQPGWGFAVQFNTTAQSLYVGFLWEFLDPADLFFSDAFNQP